MGTATGQAEMWRQDAGPATIPRYRVRMKIPRVGKEIERRLRILDGSAVPRLAFFYLTVGGAAMETITAMETAISGLPVMTPEERAQRVRESGTAISPLREVALILMDHGVNVYAQYDPREHDWVNLPTLCIDSGDVDESEGFRAAQILGEHDIPIFSLQREWKYGGAKDWYSAHWNLILYPMKLAGATDDDHITEASD